MISRAHFLTQLWFHTLSLVLNTRHILTLLTLLWLLFSRCLFSCRRCSSDHRFTLTAGGARGGLRLHSRRLRMQPHTAGYTQHTHTHARRHQTLTSRRTAAGYGRGARVRMPVPSRIVPRASPRDPHRCSPSGGGGRQAGGGQRG